MNAQTKFYTDRLAKLQGYMIVGTVFDEEGFFGLKLKKGKNEKIVWFYQDDEANGPGSFEIQDSIG